MYNAQNAKIRGEGQPLRRKRRKQDGHFGRGDRGASAPDGGGALQFAAVSSGAAAQFSFGI